MLNVCTIMGRMVRDPELRRTPSGVAVTSFTLAVDRDYIPLTNSPFTRLFCDKMDSCLGKSLAVNSYFKYSGP